MARASAPESAMTLADKSIWSASNVGVAFRRGGEASAAGLSVHSKKAEMTWLWFTLLAGRSLVRLCGWRPRHTCRKAIEVGFENVQDRQRS